MNYLIKYHLSNNDLIKWAILATKYIPAHKNIKSRKRVITIVVCLITIGIILMGYLSFQGYVLAILLVAAVLTTPIAVLNFDKTYTRQIEQGTKKIIRKVHNNEFSTKCEIIITDNSLIYISGKEETEYRKEFINEIIEDDEYILLVTGSASGFVVPNRAFESNEEKQNFINVLTEKYLKKPTK